jgi:hypothetical protein
MMRDGCLVGRRFSTAAALSHGGTSVRWDGDVMGRRRGREAPYGGAAVRRGSGATGRRCSGTAV